MCCLSVRYYTYAGSLTTPGCNEGVKWHVMATECVVPREFMSFVRTFSSMEGNYRDVMPLGEREIFGAGKFFCLKLMKLPFKKCCSAMEIPSNAHYMVDYAGFDAGLCASGTEQSPIDFPFAMDNAEARAEALMLSPKENFVHGSDTGHSLKWAPEAGVT